MYVISPGGHFRAKIWAPDPTADIWARKVGGHLGPNLPISDVTCRGIFGGPSIRGEATTDATPGRLVR